MPRQIVVDGKVVGTAPDDATDEELVVLAETLSDSSLEGVVSDLPGGGWNQAAADSALGGHATGISATPAYAQRKLAGTNIPLPFSPEESAEFIPAAIATGAGLLATRHPGAATVLGGIVGEGARQLFRRAVGAPAATGVTQEALGLDPNSAGAAAASLGGEAVAGLTGIGSAKLMKALSRGVASSAERSIVRDILGGARTEREVEEAPALARRAQAAGILRSMTKKSRLSRMQSALGGATAAARDATDAARRAGATVEAGPVLDAIQNELPSTIPGSGAPRKSAIAERRAIGRLLDDEASAVINTGGGPSGTEIPLDVAIGEIDALDDQLETMYKRGALDPAYGKKAVQTGAKAFRAQLRAALPEVADARMKQHELITITEMLKRQLGEEFSGRPAQAHQFAGVAGAASVGRYGPAGATIFSKLARATAPLSIPARQVLAKLLNAGANTAQLWIRAADMYDIGTDDDDPIRRAKRDRAAQRALQSQAEGVVAP